MPVPVVRPEDGNLWGQEAHAEPDVDVVRRVRVRVRVGVRVSACVNSRARARVRARKLYACTCEWSCECCKLWCQGLTPNQIQWRVCVCVSVRACVKSERRRRRVAAGARCVCPRRCFH